MDGTVLLVQIDFKTKCIAIIVDVLVELVVDSERETVYGNESS